MNVPSKAVPTRAQLSTVVPSKAARALCITPIIGLRARSQEYLPAIPAGYMTGVKNISICMKKGNIYLTSRYFTFTDAKNNPIPVEAMKVISNKSGTISKPTKLGMYP